MSRMKRLTVQQLDVSKDYLVIGLDLAKTGYSSYCDHD